MFGTFSFWVGVTHLLSKIVPFFSNVFYIQPVFYFRSRFLYKNVIDRTIRHVFLQKSYWTWCKCTPLTMIRIKSLLLLLPTACASKFLSSKSFISENSASGEILTKKTYSVFFKRLPFKLKTIPFSIKVEVLPNSSNSSPPFCNVSLLSESRSSFSRNWFLFSCFFLKFSQHLIQYDLISRVLRFDSKVFTYTVVSRSSSIAFFLLIDCLQLTLNMYPQQFWSIVQKSSVLQNENSVHSISLVNLNFFLWIKKPLFLASRSS